MGGAATGGGTTLGEALQVYFRDNGFGPNGGYDDAWVDFELGPVPLPFPNTKGRKRAVRFHDLHHIVTGYPTSPVGEFQISAWELGAGCGREPTAWFLNMAGLFSGAVIAPRRTLAAFARGRASRSLYGLNYPALLRRDVAEVRAEFVGEAAVDAGTRARFAALVVVGSVVSLAFTALTVPLLPLGLAKLARKRSRAPARYANE